MSIEYSYIVIIYFSILCIYYINAIILFQIKKNIRMIFNVNDIIKSLSWERGSILLKMNSENESLDKFYNKCTSQL